MFRKLRNKFVLINLITTTIILLAAFSSIYFIAKNSFETRRPNININFTDGTVLVPNPELKPFDNSNEGASDQDVYLRQILEEKIFADRKASLNSLLTTLITIGIGVEIIVACFSFIFAEQAIKPVRKAYENQKIFIANASHEIKTPIAAIKANLEAADLSRKNHWIKNIELEADKAEHLSLDLLKLAKTDITPPSLEKTAITLKPFISDIARSFEPRLSQRKIKLTKSFKLEPKTTVSLCETDFKELLEILLDNAIKYSDKKIRIELTSKYIIVENDGATIPPDKINHIFERFYQVNKSSSGSGLGLAIAQSLSNRNDWNLTAKSDSTTTSFKLEF